VTASFKSTVRILDMTIFQNPIGSDARCNDLAEQAMRPE
jgi:hypothetical protein